jgi:hypothetical protein
VPQPEFLYHYDFGDSWLHRIAFEQRTAKDIARKYPAYVDGARPRMSITPKTGSLFHADSQTEPALFQ